MTVKIVKRPSWSEQVKETIDYLKKKNYKDGDRLTKVGQLKELLGILNISMHGWNQWFHTAAMEEFDEEQLTKLCNKLNEKVRTFLEMDYKYTKEMEDRMKKKHEEEQKCAQPTQPPKQIYVA